ncbi:MAG: CcmD family protein [Cyclobacteriaceae bacterium]|nr:CcmD family protein [Cyclobacteriaceae bacterium]MDW8331648.1 CcmD family protein [Cyclobacteriaceae bacterium]
MKKLRLTFLFIFLTVLAAFAQTDVEMADRLRADGKIYVIVLIILIVLAGLFIYLFLMDRKIKKLEDRLK